MAALGSQSIASSYEQLLHVDRDGGGNTTNLVAVKDGDNETTFDIQLSSNSTNFQTDFQIGGTQVTSNAAELNLLDGSSAANSTVSKAVVLDASGNIALPNGKGIDFDATADSSGTMANELLDDYEEGTWTVGIVGSSAVALTTSAQSGKYTKIGNLVYISGYILISSENSATGAVYINGLPFTSSSGTSQQGGIITRASGLAITDDTSLTCEIEQNNTAAYIKSWDLTTGTSATQVGEISADGAITFNMTYTV